MGNQHSEVSEAPKKSEAATTLSPGSASNLARRVAYADRGPTAVGGVAEKPVLYNTPYLTVMFERLSEESRASDPSVPADVVSQAVFERVFSGPLNQLGKLLYQHIVLVSGKASGSSVSHTGGISRNEFLRVATDVLSLMLVQQQISYYFKMFSRSAPDGMSKEDADLMIMVCYTVSLACAYMPYEPTSTDLKILKAFTTSLMIDGKPIVEDVFTTWCLKNCPNLFNGVHCFLLIRLSGSSIADLGWHQRVTQATGTDGGTEGKAAATTDAGTTAASLEQEAHAASSAAAATAPAASSSTGLLQAVRDRTSALELSLIWLLSCSLPARYLTGQPPEAASRLGGSKSTWGGNGDSGLVPAAASRGGAFVPSFLVSKLHQIVEHNPWTELYNSDHDGLSTNRFETHVLSYRGPTVTLVSFESNLYVIALDEEWRESSVRFGMEDTILMQLLPRFAIVKSGSGLLFVNHHNRGSPKGIFVGGKEGGKSLVLHIDEMTRVKHYGVDLPLQQVEVWGCASSEVRDIQVRQRQWEHKEADKLSNRKLKLEAWEENPDRQLLSWAGINTNHAEKT